jgi:hypothetical protein
LLYFNIFFYVVWCEFKSRRGKNKNLTAQRSNSNTVWFNFQTYIYIYMIVKQYRTFKLLYENKSVEYILYLCLMYMHLFPIFYLEHNITSYELAERGGKCYLFLSYLI